MSNVVIHEVEQGSSPWLRLRCGLATASRFSDIVTPTGKPTANAARKRYIAELVRERLTGDAADHFTSAAMERGTKLEPRGRSFYEAETGRQVRQVGFVTNTKFAGCGGSPDALCIDAARGVEIKIPLLENLIGLYLSDDPESDYMMQMQGCMWLCELPVWDLVLFSDDAAIPSQVIEIQADAKLQAALASHVPAFIEEVDAAEKRLVELGAEKRDVFAEENQRATDEQWENAGKVSEPAKDNSMWSAAGMTKPAVEDNEPVFPE